MGAVTARIAILRFWVFLILSMVLNTHSIQSGFMKSLAAFFYSFSFLKNIRVPQLDQLLGTTLLLIQCLGSSLNFLGVTPSEVT